MLRAVPKSIARPPYADTGAVPRTMTSLFYSLLPITSPNSGINRHTAEEIELSSASAQLAAKVLAFAGTLAVPGTTTDEIDAAVHAKIVDAG